MRAPLLAVAIVTGLAAATPAQSAPKPRAEFPAAGVIRTAKLVVRAKPSRSAKVVRTLWRYRKDRQFQIVLALSSRRGADGRRWYRLSLPGRPNGTRGWVRADLVDVSPVVNRIVVGVSSRRIEVRRVLDGKLMLRGMVAVGAPGAETPRGRNFYVQSAFVPTDPFYGTYALETSAGSHLTDWPDGAIVGIHGTNAPELLGQAVSHGCIRVANDVASRLRRLAPLGTPIDIVP